MTELYVKLHLFLARHRRSVLLLVVGFAVCAVLMGRRLKLNEDFTDMLPMSDPAIAEQVGALKHIRQADRLYVDVQSTSPDPARLAEAADQTHAALREIPELGDFRYIVDAAELRDVYEELQAQLPTTLASNELRELESRLAPAALEERLAWLKKSMSQPQGLMFKEVAQSDPAGISDTVSARLRALQAGVGDAQIVAGRITSADGRHVLINAAPAFRSSDVRKSAALMDKVLKAARSVEANFTDGSVHIAITGAHRSALDNATMIREDTARTAVIAFVAVAVLMFLAYRRRWLALLGLLPTVFGALGAIVVFYLTGDPVSAVALGCGSILIGVTDDYGIYMIYHTDDAPPTTRPQLARAVAQRAPALTFGALTTMAAFFVMFASPVSGHRQLGLFSALGIALAAIFAIVILPVFIPVNAAGAGQVLPLTTFMQRLFDWRARHTRLMLPLLLLFTGLCVVGAWRLRFEGDFARLNGVTAETRRDEEAVREVWGKALSLTTVVVGGANREEALQQNERVWAVLRTLREKQVVESFSSIAPLLPSEQMRTANLRDWRGFWTEARLQGLHNSLASAAANLGFRPGAFQPFLERIAAPQFSSASAAGTNSALNRFAAEYVSEKDGMCFITTLVKAKDRESYSQMREAVRKDVPGAMLLNKTVLSDEITRIARRALPVFSVMVAGLNALLLYLLLGRLVLVLTTLLPMAVGVFWTLGTLGLLGLPIDMSNFIFVIFVIGVGGDYSLFMVLAELEPVRGHMEQTATTGGAVTVCALTTLFGVGVLVLARHPALFSIGLTALLGISFSLLATLFLVPLCMDRLLRRTANGKTYDGVPAKLLTAENSSREGAFAILRKSVGRLYRYQGPYVEQFVFWKMKIDPVFKFLDEAVPREGTILDLGCGYGMAAHWLTQCSPDRAVIGWDNDPRKIRVAQATARNDPKLRFEFRNLLDEPDHPPCDCVLLLDVLHYFPRELKAAILAEAFRALRPGGCLVLRDACEGKGNRHGVVVWAERMAVRLGQNKTAHGLHFESLGWHQAFLRETGFVGVRTHDGAGRGSNLLLVARKSAVESTGARSVGKRSGLAGH